MGTVVFRRPPRQPVPALPRGELVLESPPELAEPLPRNMAQLLMLLPMLAGGAAMAIMYANRGGGVLTYVVGGLFALSMVGMFAMTLSSSHGSKRAEVDAKRAARYVPFMDELVAAYYCALDPKTPFRVRGTLLAALAYFVLPLDFIPDFLLGFGFTDDVAVLTAAITAIRAHIKPAHRTAARKALEEAE